MAMIYFLDGNQEVIKIVRSSAVISAIQTQELPEDNSLLRDYLSVRLKNDERLFNAQYMAIKSYGGNRNAFDLYRIASELVPDNATEFMGVQVAPYELEGVVIEDLRPQNRPLNQTMNQVLEGSDWRLDYVSGSLPNVTTNFYYMSVKDALKKIQELLNVEMLFKVEISGNKITDKWVEVYHQLGNRTMKRFNYGTNALSVVRESSHDELYTALIGRGKGEEVGETESGDATYGRKINFADVEWSKSAGKPVDKPKGQKYIELPNATAEYGIKLIDGRKVPRIGIVEFSDTDDPDVLINQTYQELLVRARPKVLFKASVINTGDMLIGNTVTIHRHDLGFHYQARVRKVVRDRKNNNKTQVEIGDVVHTPSTKRQGQINSALNNVASDLENVRGELTEARQSADGKNTNFYGNAEPDRKKVGDTWFRDHPSLTAESQILVWNGEVWELIMDTSETTKNADAIAEQQQEIEDAREVADEAWNELEQAKINAGFESLDDTIQNMNYITMNAEQNAQQAITNASNAYGLAQTSISEAQTAQANSLTALGKAEDALVGVSSLDIRVDDVEAELELKADNTFMNEDGTLTTLSNAITFNAYRFRSDMSRIESRVESLAGEINLVILKDAHVGKIIRGTDIYPNPTEDATDRDTMRGLIEVSPNEQLAFSKKAGSGWVRIHQYDESYNNIEYLSFQDDERLVTTLPNAKYIWISYPRGGQPQLNRGTDFLPYRPNLVDQMTSDEVVFFRNEYDEFADRTQRRLSTIDGTGGRLEMAEYLITQTANGLSLKVDQTTFDELSGEVDSIGSKLDVTAEGISNRVWKTDIEMAVSEFDSRNLIIGTTHESKEFSTYLNGEVHRVSDVGFNDMANGGTYTASVIIENLPVAPSGLRLMVSIRNDDGTPYRQIIGQEILSQGETGKLTSSFNIPAISNPGNKYAEVHFRVPSSQLTSGTYNSFKFEKGSEAKKWTSAPEDTMVVVGHVESNLIQKYDSISANVSNIGGDVADLTVLLDGITSTVYEEHSGRLSSVEQTATGIQNAVYNADGSSKITQLATGLSNVVESLPDSLIPDSNNLTSGRWGGWLTDLSISFNRSINKKSELFVGNQGARIWFPSMRVEVGKKYKVTFDIRSHESGRRVSVGGWEPAEHRIGISSTSQSYEVVFEPRSTGDFSIYFFDTGTYEIGNVRVFETTLISETQISQLANNINLRVKEGELLSQINIEADRQLFQSGKILFDAENVVFTGKAWIPSSVIGNLEADKITSGTLDGAKARIINLDFDEAVGNKTTFVQSAWNAINSDVTIDGNSLTYSHSDGSQTIMNANGLYHREGHSNYNTNYLFDIITVTGLNSTPNDPRWVSLPVIYRNKSFKALAVFADAHGITTSNSYDDMATIRIVSYVDRPNIDYTNARVPVVGYHRARHITEGWSNHYSIQVQIIVQY